MDTPTALATLQALKNTIDGNISGFQGQSDSLAVAISQLQGILDTPSADLKAVQEALDAAQGAIGDLQTENTDLQTQITASQTVAPAADIAAPLMSADAVQ